MTAAYVITEAITSFGDVHVGLSVGLKYILQASRLSRKGRQGFAWASLSSEGELPNLTVKVLEKRIRSIVESLLQKDQ